MSRDQIRTLAEYLNVDDQVVVEHHRVLVEDDAVYAVNPVRGGSAVIVAADGSALWGNSSLTFAQLLAAFRSGRRTPPEQFTEARRERSSPVA
ncbi:hypothetical protein [Pseudoclavibacter endophyticus]|uniref:Uncharacterized protein n=1 Tax=Pseudoclavibacter endophyticus TaxID=1778590 RepID=A0A6H9WTE3_9MICO|nr:hypothetical protein [Pseudoclavibacter endophyticus]KAB1649540.1 hypothetical protein F8O04_04605 [Pseudoclavibacter endophyticus]